MLMVEKSRHVNDREVPVILRTVIMDVDKRVNQKDRVWRSQTLHVSQNNNIENMAWRRQL